VFADVEVDGADAVVSNWEAIKKAEKARDSVFDGIPTGLPALLFALKVLKKADATGLLSQVPPPSGDDLGPALFALVERARDAGVDPEDALRGATRNWVVGLRRFEARG
jgi:XTP/dITP diphosphohydrolase